ncbi:putative cytochrome P450 [Septoria linicola]|nr:putative cytochrome P450 [Septoria linicola]
MATNKSFHFDGSQDQRLAFDVDISNISDLAGLRQVIGSSCAVVKPEGLSFHCDDDLLEDVSDVEAAAGSIAIKVDGYPVRTVPGPAGLPLVGNYFEGASNAIFILTTLVYFEHFSSVDAPLHMMVLAMAEVLSINKKISSRGEWYSHLPFGDPARLKNLQKYMAEFIEQSIRDAKSSGTEDLPLQDAALRASNVIDQIDELPMLGKFIKEMQRRHNPSYQPGRTAQQDLILPGGYQVKKGTVVICAIHHISNNPKIWDNPNNFDPDRCCTPSKMCTSAPV